MTAWLAEAGLSECAGIAADVPTCKDLERGFTMFLIFLVAAGVTFILWISLGIAGSASVFDSELSGGPVYMWVTLCWGLPVLGPVLWWTVGRRRARVRRPPPGVETTV